MSTDEKPNRYLVAVAFYFASTLVAFGACLWVERFKEVFDNMSVELPWVTDGVLNLADFATHQWYILLPLLVLSLVPGFKWKGRTMSAYLWIGGALLVVPLTVLVPVQKLQAQLQQK